MFTFYTSLTLPNKNWGLNSKLLKLVKFYTVCLVSNCSLFPSLYVIYLLDKKISQPPAVQQIFSL